MYLHGVPHSIARCRALEMRQRQPAAATATATAIAAAAAAAAAATTCCAAAQPPTPACDYQRPRVARVLGERPLRPLRQRARSPTGRSDDAASDDEVEECVSE